MNPPQGPERSGARPPTADAGLPARAEEPLPGHIGRYRILGRIGAGGMGTVYKALDPELQRVVALKVPRFDPARDDLPTLTQRFLREARAAAQIRHAHVCPIYDVGEREGRPYVVMAFVEGQSLGDQLRGGGRYDDPAEAVHLVRQVLDALEAVHGSGLVHRDLKPGNILLDAAGRAVLTDFGLARAEQEAERLTADGVVVGTPAYMAPEQAAGQAERIGPRTDLYSLGVVLYRLLTGRLPFEGTAVQVLWKIGREEPPAPCSLRPGLDAGLERIVLRAIARRPEERFASAREMGAALDHWLTHADPTPLVDRGRPAAEAEEQRSTAAFTPPVTAAALAPAPPRPHYSATQVAAPEAPPAARPATRRPRWLPGLAVAMLLLGGLLVLWRLRPPGDDTPGNSAAANGQTEKHNRPQPPPVVIQPEAFAFAAGAPLGRLALVTRPAPLPGVRSWTVETQAPRGPLWALAYRPDGKVLAAAGHDGTIRLWDAATHRLLGALVGHGGPVRAVAWSPDGRYLASGSDDATVRLWEAASARPLRRLRGATAAVQALAWSPDGSMLAGGSRDTTVRLWDTANGRLHGPALEHPHPIFALAWSPDGTTLASAGWGKQVFLWEAKSARPLQPLEEHNSPFIHALAWSADGTLLASAGQDSTVRLWEGASHKALPPIALGLPVLALAWAPEGNRLATGTVEALQTWDASGRLLHTLGKHDGVVSALAWSADDTVASAGQDGAVRFWKDANGGGAGRIVGHPAGTAAIAWSPRGKELALSGFSDGWLRLWQPHTARVRLLGVRGGQVAAWAPDGKTLALAGASSSILRLDIGTMQWLAPLHGHDHEILSLAWSADSKLLASGSAAGPARIWDVASGKTRRNLECGEDGVFALAWSADDKTLALGTSRTVQLWDMGVDRPPRFLPGHQGPIRALAWSADGKQLATADGWAPGRIFLWKAPFGQPSAILAGHAGGTFALAWLSGGTTLASTGADGTVQLWDAAGAKRRAGLENHVGPVRGLAWSATARLLASTGTDSTIRLWRTDPAGPGPLLVPLRGEQELILSPEGHWAGPPGVEEHLVYVVFTEDGQVVLAPPDFARRYRWKNDPARAAVPAR
jgi:WD40 repeat protein/predicted Ser/Thr protein kinase